MDVNALNYCRFSLLIPSPDIEGELTALLAVPNLAESSLVRANYTNVLASVRQTSSIGRYMDAAQYAEITCCNW